MFISHKCVTLLIKVPSEWKHDSDQEEEKSMVVMENKGFMRYIARLLVIVFLLHSFSLQPAIYSKASVQYEKTTDYYINDPLGSTAVSIDKNGDGIILKASSEDEYGDITMGNIYVLENYKITEETECTEEMIQAVGYWPSDIWYNKDGTWTVSAINFLEYWVSCVTFNKNGDVLDHYTLQLPKNSFIYHGTIQNGKQWIRSDNSLYLLENSFYKKIFESEDKIDSFVMADNGYFAAYSEAQGKLCFYDEEARQMKAMVVKNRITECDIVDLGVMIRNSDGGYYLTVQETFHYGNKDKRPVIWQLDGNFKLLKKYSMSQMYDRMIRWDKGYIARAEYAVCLLDFDFHVVDVISDAIDSWDQGGFMQIKADGNLFLGRWDAGRTTSGYTVNLSGYDDSHIRKKNFLSADKKPCKEAGGTIKIISGITREQYEKQSGLENIKWYMYYGEVESITDGACIGISTVNEDYEEFFYFELEDEPLPDQTNPKPTVKPGNNQPGQSTTDDRNPVTPNVSSSSKIPSGAKAKKSSRKLKAPVYRVVSKAYNKKMRMIQIRIKKYAGTDIEIYFRWGKGTFHKVKLKRTNIRKNKKIFRLGYKRKKKRLYIRIRTFRIKKGKKQYSRYSKILRVKK